MSFRCVKKLRIQNGRLRSSAGFTMIELLTSIGIIVLLAGLLLVGFRGVWATAKKNKTKITILQINQLMKQSLSAIDLARGQGKELYPPIIERLSDSAKRVMNDKFKMKGALPQRWQDMVGRDGAWGTADDTAMGKIIQRKISKGEMALSDLNGATGSSEIVYLLFSEGSVYGVTLKDAGEFGADAIKDTDGDGLMEFVDAWDQPLRFYRWPTRLIRPNGLDANGGLAEPTDILWNMISSSQPDKLSFQRDPDDYTGGIYRNMQLRVNLIKDPTKLGGDMRDYMHEGDSNKQNTGNDGTGDDGALATTLHTPNTYFSYLIISSGPDLVLGLEEPTNSANFGHLARPVRAVLDILDNGSLSRDEKITALYETDPNHTNYTGLGDNITNLMQLEKK